MEQDAATAEKAILTLLLRIYVRETCFFPKLSEGWSSMRGVGNECRTASGVMGRPPNLKISEYAIARGW